MNLHNLGVLALLSVFSLISLAACNQAESTPTRPPTVTSTATIVVPSATPLAFAGESALSIAISAVQLAVDRYVAEHPSGHFPLSANGAATPDPLDVSTFDASLFDDGEPDNNFDDLTLYVKGIDFSAALGDDGSKTFVPEFLSAVPLAVDAMYDGGVLDSGFKVTGTAGVWVIDNDGKVHALINAADYRSRD